MKKIIKLGVALVAVTCFAGLAGCALPGQDTAGDRAAEGKVERLLVIGTEAEHGVHVFSSTSGPISKQYRWITVQGIPEDSLITPPISTVARIPDSIGRLHKNDLVDVYFKGLARSNFDKLESAVVLRVACPAEFPFHPCMDDLKKKEGKSYLLGPTGEPVPDLSQPQFASTPYFDQEGRPLPGKTLPDNGR